MHSISMTEKRRIQAKEKKKKKKEKDEFFFFFFLLAEETLTLTPKKKTATRQAVLIRSDRMLSTPLLVNFILKP